MSIAASDAHLPPSAANDVAYVRAAFVPLADDVRRLVERALLPQATYVLPDGTPMVPADHAALLEDAGGDPEAIAGRFCERYVAAGGAAADVEDEYAAWLSGQYGACLRDTTPEAIVWNEACKAGQDQQLALSGLCPPLPGRLT